ncbi:MAG: hypothetical protein HXX09_16255 [Bacteroidetes bacterium]|nr:hypothetical protein [Bacteroidota bacterium]
MRNFNLRVLAAVVLVAFFVSSCGLSKMAKKYETVKYEVTPNVLETHGGKIAVTIKGTFPAKYFAKKAVVTFAPVLKYDGGTTPLKSITIQGEKAVGDGKIVVAKKVGGTFSYTDTIVYDPKMNKSELVVTPRATLKKKFKDLVPERKLADGVIYTSERVMNDQDLTIAEHGYVKETFLSQAGTIYFEVNKDKLDFKLKLNKDKAAADAFAIYNDFLKKGWKIKNADITAWASPEGEESRNQGLSENRAKTANQYIKDFLMNIEKEKLAKIAKEKKEKVKKDVKIPDIEISSSINAKGEDWEGFIAAVNASDIKDKAAIVNVVNSQSDKTKREEEIRKMTVIYKEIEDAILPPLRRAVTNVTCYEPKKSDEQIAMFSTTSPDSLDNKELLYAATLTEDLATKLKIYDAATKIYANDWRGYNNAGWVLLKQGKGAEASSYLEKANTLSPNNEIVLNNLGVISCWNKDYKTGKTYFEAALAKGVNESYNLGIIMIRKGDYKGALNSFGNKTCNYNVALTQLLSGNASGASTNLDCAKKDAATYYLMAIVGARTANTTMLYSNLKSACQADASYKAQAKDDREFLKYFSVSDFTNAIQ